MTVKEILDEIADPQNSRVLHREADCDENVHLMLFGLWGNKGESLFELVYYRHWICTDTRVGDAVLYFKGVPIALTSQLCRKCDVKVKVISDNRSKYEEAIAYLYRVNRNRANEPNAISLADGVDHQSVDYQPSLKTIV